MEEEDALNIYKQAYCCARDITDDVCDCLYCAISIVLNSVSPLALLSHAWLIGTCAFHVCTHGHHKVG